MFAVLVQVFWFEINYLTISGIYPSTFTNVQLWTKIGFLNVVKHWWGLEVMQTLQWDLLGVKVKKKWKINPLKKFNEIYIAFILGVICLALFTSGKAVQLTWYEYILMFMYIFSTYQKSIISNLFKGYLHYKTIFCRNVSLDM